MQPITKNEPIRSKGKSVNKKWINECDAFIEKNLHDELKKIRGVFLPGDDFYIEGEPKIILKNMAYKILKWLNVDVDQDELVIDFCDDMEPPGLYVEIEGKKHILIKSSYKKDIFAMGAILAHELMHFYLLGKKDLRMEDVLENELLTDLCTVKFGLGLIIINGMSYKNSWILSILLIFVGMMYWSSKKLSFGYFDPKQYGKLVKAELDKKYISIKGIGGYIQPYSRTFLPFHFWNYFKAEKASRFINAVINKKRRWLAIKLIILMFVVGGVGYQSHQDSIKNAELTIMSTQIDQMEDYFEKNDAVIDALDAELYKMEDQLDKYESENNITAYNNLLSTYNTKVTEYEKYENKYKEYEKMIDEYNAKIK